MNVYQAMLNMLFAALGLYFSYCIATHKLQKKKLVCSIGHNCDAVVNSKYGKTLGIDNALLGGLYFLGMFVVQPFAFVLGTRIFGVSLLLLVIGVSVFSALFSLYFIYIMKYKLHEWCDWCLYSHMCNFLLTGSLLAVFLLY